MRLAVVCDGHIVAHADITGSHWMVIDDGIVNNINLLVELDSTANETQIMAMDDLNRTISSGKINLHVESVAKGETIVMRKGRCELLLHPQTVNA